MKPVLQFPDGFIWGTSTSGHQTEGWNEASDWWAWEQEGLIYDGTTSGVSVDYWNRFEEDHALMSHLDYQGFRLGVEWARIEPNRNVINTHALKRYRRILESLREHGIKICLTLHHWVLPKWVAAQGDWLTPNTLNDLERFAGSVLDELGDLPDFWITLNEPMVPVIAGNLFGFFPPQRRSFRDGRKVFHALLEAHARLYCLIHERVPKAPDGGPPQVGVAQAYPLIVPWGSGGMKGWYERIAAAYGRRIAYEAWDKAIAEGKGCFPLGTNFMDGLGDTYDFCGVNYYLRTSFKFDASRRDQYLIDETRIPPGVSATQMGWQIYPEGFYQILRQVWDRFQKPILVTENGIADDQDLLRPCYLVQHLAALHRAINDGVDVRGYFHWSFVDNFEWREGFKKKFGLIEVDHRDPSLERSPRKSAHLYSDIIRRNGITSDMVQLYGSETGMRKNEYQSL